ncbi:hypothetical protein FB451DRAFT_1526686 [Mycena latifolia]|nr:hypothetical protein FB451DRAFT_1526686 [Mycena latifolia]
MQSKIPTALPARHKRRFNEDIIDLDSDDEIPAAPRPALNPAKVSDDYVEVVSVRRTKDPAIIIDDSDDEQPPARRMGQMAKASQNLASQAVHRRTAPISFSLPLFSTLQASSSSPSSSSSSSSSSATRSPSSIVAPRVPPVSPTASFRPGRRLTADERAILEAVFMHNKFPSATQREELARQVGITPDRMRTWFNNRRCIWHKETNTVVRRTFPEETVSILKARFAENNIPSREELLEITTETGLTFSNRRNFRSLRP